MSKKQKSEIATKLEQNLKMPVHEWLPQSQDTENFDNLVIGIHGLGGQGEWFDNLATRVASSGIPFYSFDQQGFGRNNIENNPNSKTPRGYVESYKDWLNDIQAIYNAIKSFYPNSKITIIGHSLGAVLLSAFQGIKNSDQIILSVPGFKGHPSTFSTNFVIKTLLKFISKKLLLSKNDYVDLPIANKPGFLDPSDNDPLKVTQVSAKLLLEILLLGQVVEKNISKINPPTLFIQAKEDIVVCNKTIDKFFDKIPSSKKDKLTFNNAVHDWIWYDSVEEISESIIKWIKTNK